VDGAALEFELINGVKTTLNPNDGSPKETPVSELEDTDVYRWTTNANGLCASTWRRDPAKHQLTYGQPNLWHPNRCQQPRNAWCKLEVRDARHGVAFAGPATSGRLRGARRGHWRSVRGSQNVLLRARSCNVGKGCISPSRWQSCGRETFVLGTASRAGNRPPQADLDNPWDRDAVCALATPVSRLPLLRDCRGLLAGWCDVNCYGNYFYGNLVTRISDRASTTNTRQRFAHSPITGDRLQTASSPVLLAHALDVQLSGRQPG